MIVLDRGLNDTFICVEHEASALSLHPDGGRKYVNWFINLTVLKPVGHAEGLFHPGFLVFY